LAHSLRRYEPEDGERSGRPSAIGVDGLPLATKSNLEATTRELATTFGCTRSTIELHLHDLGYRKVLTRWIPHKLTEAHMQVRMNVCQSLLTQPHREEVPEDLVTGDESWIICGNSARHAVWLPRDAEPTVQPKPEPQQCKHLLCVWWDAKGPIYRELLVAGKMVTTSIYVNQLQKLTDAMREKRRIRPSVHLLHDNARPNVASTTGEKIAEPGWHPVAHPPYSQDLAPSNYLLFAPLKHHLTGEKFERCDDLKMAVDNFIKSQSADLWTKGNSDLPSTWEKAISLCCEYIVKIPSLHLENCG
uniref:HTH_48 domain-containing protein n=1 Tax=Heligmosomoides polygyrus TaxID=6339 RepID=A0A183GEJ0_HELPZ